MESPPRQQTRFLIGPLEEEVCVSLVNWSEESERVREVRNPAQLPGIHGDRLDDRMVSMLAYRQCYQH